MLRVNVDFQDLSQKIRRAAEIAFDEVRKKHRGETFCGYALYSDSDGVTVCPAMNSKKHLDKMIDGDPKDEEYYRWSPGEWCYEFEGSEYFKNISDFLSHQLVKLPPGQERISFRNEVYECCVTALEDMKKASFFEDMDYFGVVVFTVSDAENESECNWIERLNSEELASKFQNWMIL